MSTLEYINQLAEAVQSSFIDDSVSSDHLLQAKLLTNDYEKKNKVLTVLLRELEKCDTFMFSVAYVTEGGITTLLNAFEVLKAKGIKGKILTSTYQLFNTPKTFKRLLKLSEIVDVRIYNHKNFHAKGYIFKHGDEGSNFIVGSSNLTQNALTYNHEWNLKLNTSFNGALTKELEREFEATWNRSEILDQAWIESYEKTYDASKIVDINKALQAQANQGLKLNKMQREALKALEELRYQGKKKAILISATGTGKTYLSAFDVLAEQPKKFLFVIHRENVAVRAMESYKHVLGDGVSMTVLSGNHHLKEVPEDYIFATIQTMSKDRYLERFAPDYFDYIVIDEVHRAGAKTYEKILTHFKPKFLLGMSATPERTDGFNVVELFDYNIAYEIRLQDAMAYDLLCPFHYFGVKEFLVDGEEVDEQSDFKRLTDDKRIDHIISKMDYYGYSGNRPRGLVFCSRKEEAITLSKKFNQRGYRTSALTGESSEEKRRIAIDRLEQFDGDNSLDYVFTVDIFNEGIDIPSVNQVIMLRPTESSIIFIQQLGRGLRKSKDKEFVVVLDFIGNYKNNFMIPLALSGDRTYNKDVLRRFAKEGNSLIPGCSTINFDEVSKKKLYESINRAKFNQANFIKKEYTILKNIVGRVPTVMDFYEHGAIDPGIIFSKYKTYYNYLLRYDAEDYGLVFDAYQCRVLEFVTTEFCNCFRPHEALILELMIQSILDGGVDSDGSYCINRLSIQEALISRFALNEQEAVIEHSLGILMDKYLQNKDRLKYGHIRFVSRMDNGYVYIDADFVDAVRDMEFTKTLMDLLEYVMTKFKEVYYQGNNSRLVLYEKYTRRDVCRLLLWDNDEGSTVNGYRIKHGTCPIFVTYNKDKDLQYTIQYQDAFVSRNQFSWLTRSPRYLTSRELEPLLNQRENGLKVHLFIKKGDDEGSAHYYLGEMKLIGAVDTEITDEKSGNSKPIVNVRFAMETPVREELFDYITG